MAGLNIHDVLRVEEHLSKKIKEACSEFRKFLVIKISKRLNGQPFSRNQFENIYRNACDRVQYRFLDDCDLLKAVCPDFRPVVDRMYYIGSSKIDDLHDLEWQFLVRQLP